MKIHFYIVLLIILVSCTTLNPIKKDGNVTDLTRPLIPVVRLYDIDSEMSFCSGVVIRDDEIITAAHCFENKDLSTFKVNVRSQDKSDLNIISTSIKVYRAGDLAQIKGNFSQFSKIEIEKDYTNFYERLEFTPLYAYGFIDFTLEILVTRVEKPNEFAGKIRGFGELAHGMSGGPLIDFNTKKVIGISYAFDPNRPEIIFFNSIEMYDQIFNPTLEP